MFRVFQNITAKVEPLLRSRTSGPLIGIIVGSSVIPNRTRYL